MLTDRQADKQTDGQHDNIKRFTFFSKSGCIKYWYSNPNKINGITQKTYTIFDNMTESTRTIIGLFCTVFMKDFLAFYYIQNFSSSLHNLEVETHWTQNLSKPPWYFVLPKIDFIIYNYIYYSVLGVNR